MLRQSAAGDARRKGFRDEGMKSRVERVTRTGLGLGCFGRGSGDWEGVVRVSQEGVEVGRAYLELTGYADALRLGRD